MTGGTSHLVEQFLATLHLFAVQVAGTGDSQSAMPHHELVVIVILHLRLEVVYVVVKLVGVRRQQGRHSLGYAFAGAVGIVGMEQ